MPQTRRAFLTGLTTAVVAGVTAGVAGALGSRGGTRSVRPPAGGPAGPAASAAPAAGGARAGAGGSTERIPRAGIQLYTVRSAMARDFDGTLDRLAALGYDEVEFAGYHDRAPTAVRAALDRTGLAAPAAHVGYEAVRDQLPATLAAAAEVGHRWVVLPWIPAAERSADGYARTADLMNRAGEGARRVGLRFAYHNHDFEFEPLPGGRLPFDFLLERTAPELVDFEMDLYWVSRPGHDPLAYFDRHPGRFPLVHVKDMDGTPARGMVDPGQGVINFRAVAAAGGRAGIRHWFVEHDQPDDPFETARAGLDYLRSLSARAP